MRGPKQNVRMKSLIKKYDIPGPRYTSYPPVPFWKVKPSEEDWVSVINTSLREDPWLDLYVHIPFCEQLCYYCGCNRIITKDKSKSDEYAQILIREWELYKNRIEDFSIHSLHFGGGTPTFLSPEILEKLLIGLTHRVVYDYTGAIEIDPRTCTQAHLDVLQKFGIQRLSLGIQDFDPTVQEKINRKQSFELVRNFTQKIREMKFESLNFDLIYGLPGQTIESIKNTIDHISVLLPDTIAFYSYAHLPDRIANQRLIKPQDLPQPEQKLDLYLRGQELLKSLGYVNIGMDHFALPGSFLTKTITRSFMGYTDKKGPLLIGLGSSAIGSGKGIYVQNEKDVSKYGKDILNNKIPIAHGHRLSQKEQEIASLLQDLFCLGEVTLPMQYQAETKVFERLYEMERDGLIEMENHHHLKVTSLGKNFLRNIAMVLDPLLEAPSPVRFSQTV